MLGDPIITKRDLSKFKSKELKNTNVAIALNKCFSALAALRCMDRILHAGWGLLKVEVYAS